MTAQGFIPFTPAAKTTSLHSAGPSSARNRTAATASHHSSLSIKCRLQYQANMAKYVPCQINKICSSSGASSSEVEGRKFPSLQVLVILSFKSFHLL